MKRKSLIAVTIFLWGLFCVCAPTLADEEKKKDEDEEYKEYVFVFDNGIAKLQEVETGIQDNTYIEIVSGLQDSLEVIVAPYRAVTKRLKNGDEVKKVDKEELFSEEK